jgi:hypothetical protein
MIAGSGVGGATADDGSVIIMAIGENGKLRPTVKGQQRLQRMISTPINFDEEMLQLKLLAIRYLEGITIDTLPDQRMTEDKKQEIRDSIDNNSLIQRLKEKNNSHTTVVWSVLKEKVHFDDLTEIIEAIR